jgi:hypothetical protein
MQYCGYGIQCLLISGTRIDNKSRSGSGRNIPVHISENLKQLYGVKNKIHECACGNLFDHGTWIQNRYPGSATQLYVILKKENLKAQYGSIPGIPISFNKKL